MDRWANARAVRTSTKERADRGFTRFCPQCAGTGNYIVYATNRLDPPVIEDCPTCDGWQKISADEYERVTFYLRRVEEEMEYVAKMAEWNAGEAWY